MRIPSVRRNEISAIKVFVQFLVWITRYQLTFYLTLLILLIVIYLQYIYLFKSNQIAFSICIQSKQRKFGRIDSLYPSPRCCSGSDCLEFDRGRYAILTTLRTDEYFPYLKKLSCSILNSNPGLKLIVATVINDLSEDVKTAIKLLGSHVELVYWKEYRLPNELRERYSLNWIKIRAWELSQYDALLMIDSDTVVLDDVTHLFKLPTHFAAALDEDKNVNIYSSLGSMQGGVILLRPCDRITAHMSELLHFQEDLRFTLHHAEQDFFDWYFRYERMILPTTYNSMKHLLDSNGRGRNGLKPIIVHDTRKVVNINFALEPIDEINTCNFTSFF